MTLEDGMRRNGRDTDSSVGRNNGNLSANKVRKNRRDDKIPFTPDVSFAKSLLFQGASLENQN